MSEIRLILDPLIKNSIIYYINAKVVYKQSKNKKTTPLSFQIPFTLKYKNRVIEKVLKLSPKNKIDYIKISIIKELGTTNI